LEETGDILFEADVIVDCPFDVGLKLHQYIEVTVRPVVAPRTEPNTAACATPRARKALSWRRRVARAS
jgi:hypothetical protein